MPNNYPYDRWYWSDWFAATRLVSIMTRGVWHEMLGLMWMNDRADSLTGTADELAHAVGGSIADIEMAISEIERRNLALVAHCNGFVTITCRRYKKANNERKRIREAVHNTRSNKPVTDTRAEYQYPITNIQSTKESKPKKNFSKPTIARIAEYCQERKNNIDAERFFDYYESKGWKIGNTPMKSWQAAVRTWEKNDKKGGHSNGAGNGKSFDNSPESYGEENKHVDI